MSKFKTICDPGWFDEAVHPEFASWLRPLPDDNKIVFCSLCQRRIELSNMGIQALKSHAKGTKHIRLCQSANNTPDISSFFKKPSTSASVPKPPAVTQSNQAIKLPIEQSSKISESSSKRTLEGYGFKKEVFNSEVLWCLGASNAHLSNRQAEKVAQLFPFMFPDSKIAEKFAVGKDKLGYLSTHGLYPHFKDITHENLSLAEFFAVSYDESLNKIAQKSQMDISVRHVDPKDGLVKTRYLTSEFLTSCKALDLLNHLTSALKPSRLDRLVHVAMDGPNVNWKMLNDLKLSRRELHPDSHELVEFGSCALHVVHNALKQGHTKSTWNIFKYLRDTFYLFSGFPSRKAQYTNITNSDAFPQKFCVTRWVQNGSASSKAQDILPNIKKYVDTVGKLPSSKVFVKVQDMVKDPLLAAKLGFFHGMANHLEKFLVQFQSENPLVPFLYQELFSLTKSLLKRILKPEIYRKIDDYHDINKIDLNSPKFLREPKDIDLFHSAKAGLKSARSDLNAKMINEFRSQCLNFIIGTISKLLEKSPLKYPVTKALSCLSPTIILNNSLSRLDNCISYFMDRNIITGIEGDQIKEDYVAIKESNKTRTLLEAFDWKSDRLDELFNVKMRGKISVSKHFIKFVNLIFILFHGNANVERGFSINKHCLSDNLQEESLVARRMICEQVSIAGGPPKVELTNSLLLSCKNANGKWKESLKRKRETESEEIQARVKKQMLLREISELEANKGELDRDTERKKSIINEQILAARASLAKK